MSEARRVNYEVDFGVRQKKRAWEPESASPHELQPVPRIARLLALAIRLEGMIRGRELRDYAAIAVAGRVTRARMTQIMKLNRLAPDLQEEILFLPPTNGLNERMLRPVSKAVDWAEQRQLFLALVGGREEQFLGGSAREKAMPHGPGRGRR